MKTQQKLKKKKKKRIRCSEKVEKTIKCLKNEAGFSLTSKSESLRRPKMNVNVRPYF